MTHSSSAMAAKPTPQAIDPESHMNMSSILSKVQIMNKGIFAAGLLGVSLALTALTPIASSVYAADSDAAAMEEPDRSRFIRMGLNKSVVVQLPADAKDVVVGNSDVVDTVIRTKNKAYLFGRSLGQTNIFFFDANGQQILALDLEVSLDVTAIRKLINRALPGNSIVVDTANSNIILGGVARNNLEAKTATDLAKQFVGASEASVVNTMSVAGEDQVMLKVKVIEIQRDVLKQLGVDLSALLDAGKFAFNLANINPFTNTLTSPFGGYKGVFSSGGTQIEGLVRAMEGDGLVRTLAEPNLTAMTGQEANFHAGGEYPYQLCDETTTKLTCTIEFKNFGVEVKFTPTVLSEDRINLKIKTDVSELSSIAGLKIPAISRRSAETTLELPSGGSMMIAGLIKESTRQNINGTPGLKQLPVLGALFRSKDFVSNETELVVIVTPVLVRPTAQGQLTSPDKNFNPATEAQTILFGRLNKVYGGGDAPQGKYNGNVGFIVE
jgi:pilus assembly protein CpaC